MKRETLDLSRGTGVIMPTLLYLQQGLRFQVTVMLMRHGRPHPASSVLLSFEKGNRRGDKQHDQQGRTHADSCTISTYHYTLGVRGQDHFSDLCLAS